MNRYIGVKIINAEPAQATEDDKRGQYPIGAEGYKVVYEDGYTSWSPKEVFDAAYRQTDGLTFGLAIEALKLGKKVARAGWNGKGMWLIYINPIGQGINDEVPYYQVKLLGEYGLLPWIGMKTFDNKFVPWLASQTDVLADDWVIVE